MWQARKFLVILAAVGIAGLWSAAASAGCKKIGGTYMCASWITGSEDLLANITGLGNIKDDCSAGDCPTVYAAVFGTEGRHSDPSCLPSSTNPQPGCSITGVLYCTNPASKSSQAQGQPYSSDTTITASGVISSSDCSKNGKCTQKVKAELDFTQSNPCINNNWKPLSFVASEFWGVSELDFIDSKGQLTKIQILDFCQVNLTSSYKPGQMYSCIQYPYQ